ESGLFRDRYVHVTERGQVRRMPVALAVTVEQAHIPNVLAAFSNSPLRMQVTQVHMVHVRSDMLRPPAEGGAPGVPGGPDDGGLPPKPGFPRSPRGEGGTPDDLGPGVARPGFPALGGPPGTSGSPAGQGLFAAGAGEEDEGNLVGLTV